MEPCIGLISPGVADPGRAIRCCEEGLRRPRLPTPPSVAFFEPGKTRLAARMVKPGHASDRRGYPGSFTDPDDLLRELACNPAFQHV